MRIIKTLAISAVAMLAFAFNAHCQHYDRGFDLSNPVVFVEKGTWMAGGTANWSFHENDNYNLALIEGIDSRGYKLSVSPAACYMIKDNMGIGIRADYKRNMLKIDEASLGFGDVSLDVNNYHKLNHKFTVMGIMRNYLPLGNSKRFAMISEIQLALGYGQGKIIDGHGGKINGSYEQVRSTGLNFCPGMMAFVDDHLSVEFNVNMLGINRTKVSQVHNQVDNGNRSSTVVNFKVNILSVGFGLYYYL